MVPIGDLKRQNLALQSEIEAAVSRVLVSGWYILGQEVTAFEQEFADYCGAKFCVGVASGAEALYLALCALDIGPDDEVITVANACMYQIAAITQAGAKPVLVDIDSVTSNIDPQAVAAAITPHTKAIIPVHLYGRMANMQAIQAIASRYGIAIIEDAAQAHGAWSFDLEGQQRRAGNWGTLACFSFYPSKNLGAIGDGGAVVTNDSALAQRLRQLRMYGWESKYYTVDRNGRNSRLDELQAAILRVKLCLLDAGNEARRERANWYRELLAGLPLELPRDEPGHVYHLFVVALDNRNELREQLTLSGIGCDVHYPIPSHLQPAYAAFGSGEGSLPETEKLAKRILTLPLFPELSRSEVEQVATTVRAFLQTSSYA